MKKITLTIVLISCVSIIFAQENAVVSNEQPKEIQFPKNEIALSVGDNMFHNQIWEGYNDAIGFGSYSLSYHYRIKNWLWCGAYVNAFPTAGYGYYGSSTRSYALSTKISVAPSIRFSYFNKPLVNLYSAASVGWGMSINEKDKQNLNLFFQVTFFGVSIGKKFFGGAEVGIGYKGLFCANLGYRF